MSGNKSKEQNSPPGENIGPQNPQNPDGGTTISLEELPESLRDPIKVMKRGRELLEAWGPTPVTDAFLAGEQCSYTLNERRCALRIAHEGSHKYPGGRYS